MPKSKNLRAQAARRQKKPAGNPTTSWEMRVIETMGGRDLDQRKVVAGIVTLLQASCGDLSGADLDAEQRQVMAHTLTALELPAQPSKSDLEQAINRLLAKDPPIAKALRSLLEEAARLDQHGVDQAASVVGKVALNPVAHNPMPPAPARTKPGPRRPR